MTLDDALTALSTVCERGSVTAVAPADALAAIRVLLAENERLGAVVSDADALLEPIFLPRSGRTIYVDVRGHVLAGVLRRQA